MAAINTDLLKKLSRKWVGQIGSAGVTDAVVTTIPLSSTTNLATDTAVVATIDRVDANGTKTPTLEESVIGVVSGSNLVTCTRGSEGTAQAHSAGAVVEVLVTAKGYNDIIDHLLVEHTQSGVHATAVFSNSLYYQALINAGFTVNQRGYVSNATLAAGAYGHDRWKAGAGGGDYTFTQLAQATTITIKAGKSLIQVIENKNVIGGTYTLSWTGTAQARFGKDSATPSGAYAASPITITAQTAGTVMSVEFNEGTLSKVQLNSGDVALPFMAKSFNEELRACQRYFEKSFPIDVTPADNYGTDPGPMLGAAFNITNVRGNVLFKVRKRTSSPTIAFYNAGPTTAGQWEVWSGVWGDKVMSAVGTNDTSFSPNATVSGYTANECFMMMGYWTADAEL